MTHFRRTHWILAAALAMLTLVLSGCGWSWSKSNHAEPSASSNLPLVQPNSDGVTPSRNTLVEDNGDGQGVGGTGITPRGDSSVGSGASATERGSATKDHEVDVNETGDTSDKDDGNGRGGRNGEDGKDDGNDSDKKNDDD